jgi:hypothetical protein
MKVKSTQHKDESRGYLPVGPPSGKKRMDSWDVDDCIYVLVQPDDGYYVLSGWVNLLGFLNRKVENPFRSRTPCWGVFWKKLIPIEELPTPTHVNFVVLPAPADTIPPQKSDLWYGFSAREGWLVINWKDPRNQPGKLPRYLHMLRGRDDAGVRIRFDQWSTPHDYDAADYLAAQKEADRERLTQELKALQVRIENSKS